MTANTDCPCELLTMLLSALVLLCSFTVNARLNPFDHPILVEDAETCFRRAALGRRLIDRYIVRSLSCDSLRLCEEECTHEKNFNCEGFNFRFEQERSACQLTSVPFDHLDLTVDFNADPNYDYFERDRNAPHGCWQRDQTWSYWSATGGPPAAGSWNSGASGGWQQQHSSSQGGASSDWQSNAVTSSTSGGWSGNYPVSNYAPTSANWQHSDQRHPQPHYPNRPFWGSGYGYGDGTSYSHLGGGFPGDRNSLDHASLLPHIGYRTSDECFIRTRTGFTLERSVVVLSLAAPSLYDCEMECTNEQKFTCNIFSYKYSASPSVPGDNCHLGERLYHSLDLYTDIIPDREYDIYVRNEFVHHGGQGCMPKMTWDSDCFERVRSGLRLSSMMIKYSMNTHSVVQCEQECIDARLFTCRAFSYRYGSPTIGQSSENCLMTDWPIAEMNPLKHFVEENGCELYHRGSYGHGCEFDRLPPSTASYHPSPNSGPVRGHDNSLGTYRPDYYPIAQPKPHLHQKLDYYPPKPHPKPVFYPSAPSYLPPYPAQPSFKLPPSPPSYLPPYPARPSQLMPPPFAPSNNIPPTGSYGQPKPPATYLPPPTNNLDSTYLPPMRPSIYIPPSGGGSGTHTYLPPTSYGVQRQPMHRPQDRMCYISYGAPARLMPSAVRSSMHVPNELECKIECSRARDESVFRCATVSYKDSRCDLSDIEQRDLVAGKDFDHDHDCWLFSWDFSDARCYVPPPQSQSLSPSRPDPFWDRSLLGTWSRYTVSGQPCRPGTYCTQNRDIGIWSCPVEGGDWDYCCRSGHHCGYSEGYSYPWCYVGSAARDQWRPCSETYYPYPNQNRPLHWPVAYLHREAPPTNQTTEHMPSIVDNFLESLRHEHARKMAAESRNTTFQAVDLRIEPRTEEKSSAMTKLWTWGQSKYNTTTTSTTETSLNETTTKPNADN